MKAGLIVSLVYAHATEDKGMWERTISAICEDECLKGQDVLARDIEDANKGILHTEPRIPPTSHVILSKEE